MRSPSKGLLFAVKTRPQPGGSKEAVDEEGLPYTRLVDANPHVGQYREQIAVAARIVWQQRGLLLGPLTLALRFYFARYKSHYNADGEIIKWPQKITDPDTTKLVRPVEDALTGIVWQDDNLVVCQYADKQWVDIDDDEGVLIRVETFREDETPPEWLTRIWSDLVDWPLEE